MGSRTMSRLKFTQDMIPIPIGLCENSVIRQGCLKKIMTDVVGLDDGDRLIVLTIYPQEKLKKKTKCINGKRKKVEGYSPESYTFNLIGIQRRYNTQETVNICTGTFNIEWLSRKAFNNQTGLCNLKLANVKAVIICIEGSHQQRCTTLFTTNMNKNVPQIKSGGIFHKEQEQNILKDTCMYSFEKESDLQRNTPIYIIPDNHRLAYDPKLVMLALAYEECSKQCISDLMCNYDVLLSFGNSTEQCRNDLFNCNSDLALSFLVVMAFILVIRDLRFVENLFQSEGCWIGVGRKKTAVVIGALSLTPNPQFDAFLSKVKTEYGLSNCMSRVYDLNKVVYAVKVWFFRFFVLITKKFYKEGVSSKARKVKVWFFRFFALITKKFYKEGVSSKARKIIKMNRYVYLASVAVFLMLVCIHAQTFDPKLTVRSCNRNHITFTLTDAANGGLVYIQGSGSGCRHATFSGSNTYGFNFAACNIIWGRSFRIVIQQKSLYQTGDDKIIPVTCIVDLSDISVQASVDASAGNDDPPQTVVVRPTAFMTLFSRRSDVRGKLIQLSANITMNIELHNQYKGEFDIQATTCTASTITVITDGCPTDLKLLPQFTKLGVGALTTTFQAFVPTEYTSITVSITFSCSLDMCLNTCPMPSCSNLTVGPGRRRRYDEKFNTTYEQLHVDSTLTISTGNGVLIEEAESDGSVCLHKPVFVVCLILMFITLLVTVYLVLAYRWKHKEVNKSWQYYCQYEFT